MEPFVETERLLLREILPEDEEALFELDSDPDVHRYVGKRPVETREQIKMVIAFIRQQYEDNGIGRWAVIEKTTGQLIGWAGLKLFTDEVNGIKDFHELGYRFMKKHWGKGYATEASKAIVNYGFEELGLTDIYGMTDPENLASKKVLEKTGLKYLETFDFSGEATDWFLISKK
ncbi:MAG: GNAT family N-acetyltransferase [Bacteroidota bacterium]